MSKTDEMSNQDETLYFHQDETLNVHQWDPDAIELKPFNKSSTNKKFRLISKQTKNVLTLQTPPAHTWGVQDYIDKDNKGDGKFKISYCFSDDKESCLFKEKFEKFCDKITDIANANSKLFFGKERSRDAISESFAPVLKYSKIKESNEIDYTKPPSMKFKLNNIYNKETQKYDTNRFDINIFDKNSNIVYPNDNIDDIPGDHITNGSTIICIIKIVDIWVVNSSWGVTIIATQALVVNKGGSYNSNICKIKFNYNDNDNNYKNNIESKLNTTVVSNIKNDEKYTFDDDDDDDDNDNNEKKINDNDDNESDDNDSDDNDSDDNNDNKLNKNNTKLSVSETIQPAELVKPLETIQPSQPTVKKIIKKIIKKST